MIGKVKWFNDELGFGFLIGKNNEEIFIHHSYINEEGYRSLSKDQLVRFELSCGPKGIFAKNVVILKEF